MYKNEDIFQGASVPRTIAKFAIPTVLSQLVTLIYNLADTFFVGRTNDPSQVAALTLSFPIFMMLTMVGNLFGIGANSYISRSLGQGDKKRAKKASTFAFYGALIVTLALGVILGLLMQPILTMIGAVTPESFEATRKYLTWTVICGGLPTVSALMLGHLIRSEGNTKQASVGLALGGILNIILDGLFVPILGMGAEGAAIATLISNIISFLYLLRIVLKTKDTVIVLNPAKFSVEIQIAKQIILVGLPAAALIILASTANLILTHFMSVYGDHSIAAYGIVQKIGSIAIQIAVGLTQGIMPLLGYCYGAGDMKRLKEINKYSFAILSIYALACVVMVEVFAQGLVGLFMNEPITVQKAVSFVRVWFLCAPGMCMTNLFGSIFQAMGKWIPSLALSVIRLGILFMPLILIMQALAGEFGLICAQPIADTVTLVVGIILYVDFMRKTKNDSSQSK